MTEAANPDRTKIDARPSGWASKIAARYRCELSAELVDWFDQEIWNESGHGEYRQPIHPDELLVDAPEAIWPALMPCDLLPISGNTAGDWLCLRIDENNTASAVVQWYHGGGDWIPWGRTLAEAFLFDALSIRLPGPLRRHSVPAENPRLDSESGSPQPMSDPLLRWATKNVPPDVAALLGSDASESIIARTLLQHGVAEVAVRCEAVQDALHQSITASLDRKLAAQWNVPWPEMVAWTFDAKRIPSDRRSQLEEHLGREIADEQDWVTAQEHCRAVTKINAELSWPWEILGYAAERTGDAESALSAYLCASRCSVFTDQSVRLRTHWTSDRAAKFSVSRLLDLQPGVVTQDEYLKRLCTDDIQQRRREACGYWRARASSSREQGCFADAYQYEMSAGWDLGAEPMVTFGVLLESIADSAAQAGQFARAELARTHRACLASRYRI